MFSKSGVYSLRLLFSQSPGRYHPRCQPASAKAPTTPGVPSVQASSVLLLSEVYALSQRLLLNALTVLSQQFLSNCLCQPFYVPGNHLESFVDILSLRHLTEGFNSFLIPPEFVVQLLAYLGAKELQRTQWSIGGVAWVGQKASVPNSVQGNPNNLLSSDSPDFYFCGCRARRCVKLGFLSS